MAVLVPAVLGLAVVVIGGWLIFAQVKDRHDRAAAESQAKVQFASVSARIAQRLHQDHPVEYGAVWMTHQHRICGLLNAENSFGGLAGMIGFFTDGPNIRYGLDGGDPATFGQTWAKCGADTWVQILPGSMEQGFCATRNGAKHCFTTSERQVDNP